MSATLEQIKQQIQTNPVILYMKGTPQFPMCGFSSRVTGIFQDLNVNFAFVNVLENPDIRQELPKYADWPTFPQLYIQGELVGGCDIICDMQQAGELLPLLENAGAIAEQSSFTNA